MLEYGLLLLTFNQFVNESILNPLLKYPALLIGLLVGLSAYFGFLWSFHRIKETPYLKKIIGMVIVVYNFGFYLIIAYFFVKIIPLNAFENGIILGIFELLILAYTLISTLSIARLSEKCDSSMSYEEVFPKSVPLPTGLMINSKSIIHLITISFSPLIQFITSYIIITYEKSIPIGLFMLSIIFLGLTFYSIYLGINPDSYRYAEIFLKIPQRKSIKGRLKKIDDNSVDVLVKNEAGNYLTEIPMDNISRIELRNLGEITKKIKR